MDGVVDDAVAKEWKELIYCIKASEKAAVLLRAKIVPQSLDAAVV